MISHVSKERNNAMKLFLVFFSFLVTFCLIQEANSQTFKIKYVRIVTTSIHQKGNDEQFQSVFQTSNEPFVVADGVTTTYAYINVELPSGSEIIQIAFRGRDSDETKNINASFHKSFALNRSDILIDNWESSGASTSDRTFFSNIFSEIVDENYSYWIYITIPFACHSNTACAEPNELLAWTVAVSYYEP